MTSNWDLLSQFRFEFEPFIIPKSHLIHSLSICSNRKKNEEIIQLFECLNIEWQIAKNMTRNKTIVLSKKKKNVNNCSLFIVYVHCLLYWFTLIFDNFYLIFESNPNSVCCFYCWHFPIHTTGFVWKWIGLELLIAYCLCIYSTYGPNQSINPSMNCGAIMYNIRSKQQLMFYPSLRHPLLYTYMAFKYLKRISYILYIIETKRWICHQFQTKRSAAMNCVE